MSEELQPDASFEQKTERELKIYCGVKCNICNDNIIQKTTTILTTCACCSNVLVPLQIKYHIESENKDIILDGSITRCESIRKMSVSSNDI